MNTPTPDTGQVRQMVDMIIIPGAAESQFKAFTSLLNIVAGAGEAERLQIAEIASAQAYTHTEDFAEKFREFVGWMPEAVHDPPLVHHESSVS